MPGAPYFKGSSAYFTAVIPAIVNKLAVKIGKPDV